MRSRPLKVIMLLLPQFILTFILIYGVIFGLVQSLGYIPALGLTDLTFDYYVEVLQDKQVYKSILFSLWIAFISSTFSLGIALIICYFFTRQKKVPTWLEKIIQVPIIIPHLIVALFAIQFLGQTGILARLLYHCGLEQAQHWLEPFLFDPQGKGIILAYLWKEVPFIIFYCFTMIRQINGSLGEAAQTLGATPLQSYVYVTLPLCKKTILSSYLIVFLFSLGAYELPALLGPTLPQTLPEASYQAYIHPDLHRRPYAMAMNGLIVLISLVISLILLLAMYKPKDMIKRRRKNSHEE